MPDVVRRGWVRRGYQVWARFRSVGERDRAQTCPHGGCPDDDGTGQPVEMTSVTTSEPSSCVSTATLTRVSTKSAVTARSSPSRRMTRNVYPADSSVADASSTDSPTTSGTSPATGTSVAVSAGAVLSDESSSDPHAE